MNDVQHRVIISSCHSHTPRSRLIVPKLRSEHDNVECFIVEFAGVIFREPGRGVSRDCNGYEKKTLRNGHCDHCWAHKGGCVYLLFSLQKIFGSGGGLRSVFFTRGLRGGNIREPLLKRTNGSRSCWKLPLYPPADRRGLAVLAEATTGCPPGEISWFGAA